MLEKKTLTEREMKSKFGDKDYSEFNAIVEKAIGGDKDALIELCDKIIRSVLFRSVSIMGNEADGEDVSQEVMIRVCERIKDLREPKAFNVWLSRIIINEVNRYHKKNSKQGVSLDSEENELANILIEERESVIPHEYAENKECRSAVMEIISTLSLRQRQAIMLHYYDDLSITKTAEAMGVTQQNVSQLLAHARKKLKVGLEERNFKMECMGASAAVPIGLFFSDVLVAEAVAFSQTCAAMVTTTLTACSEAVLTGAGVAAEAGAAAGANFSGTVNAIIVGGVTTVITAILLFLGLSLGGGDYEAVPIEINSEIVFSGGIDRQDGTVHINPENAYLEITGSGGDVRTLYWWIARSDDDAAILEGDGYALGDALTQIPGSGEHWLFFVLQDESDALIRVSRNFYIMEE